MKIIIHYNKGSTATIKTTSSEATLPIFPKNSISVTKKSALGLVVHIRHEKNNSKFVAFAVTAPCSRTLLTFHRCLKSHALLNISSVLTLILFDVFY